LICFDSSFINFIAVISEEKKEGKIKFNDTINQLNKIVFSKQKKELIIFKLNYLNI